MKKKKKKKRKDLLNGFQTEYTMATNEASFLFLFFAGYRVEVHDFNCV